MIQYDPNVIQSFVEGLYAKSRRVAMSAAVCGTLVGIVLGFFFAAVLRPTPDIAPIVHLSGAAIGGIFLGMFGYRHGMDRSFHLRLQAQLTLCQMMTEFNTRRAADNATHPARPAPPKAAA